MVGEVEYLYHYTSIENLALILKNRTIRLSPLDQMDDLQEQKTADVENLGRFVFISSWTDDTTESIPMWKMYTIPSSGVRIKLRKNPFVWHGTLAQDIENVLGIKMSSDTDPNSKISTFLDLSKLMAEGYYSVQAWNGQILNKVNYTGDINKLEPNVANIEDGKITLKTGDIGKYKNLHWAFQNEWRYIMTFISMNFKAGIENMGQLFSLTVNNMLSGQESPPFRYYDLDIDSECFMNMEITCSPQLTPGNRVLLETLVEKYNPTASIVDSKLLGLI